MKKRHSHCIVAAMLAAALLAQQAAGSAAHAQSEGILSIELNKAADTKNGCQLFFVVNSTLSADIDRAAWEFVLFGKDGLVSRMAVFDFQKLPKQQSRVRQFTLDGLQCGELTKILVNDAAECTAATGPTDDCAIAIAVSTKADVRFEK